MAKTPDFLKKEKREVTEEDMKTLAGLIKTFKERQQLVKEAESALKAAQAAFNDISMNKIPEFLEMKGFTGLKLSNGENLKIKEDLNVSIEKGKENNFFAWLTDRGDVDIIKQNYEFGILPDEMTKELNDFLLDHDFEYLINKSVHPQTRKKYFKELLADGTVNREDLPEYIHIFDIKKTEIK